MPCETNESRPLTRPGRDGAYPGHSLIPNRMPTRSHYLLHLTRGCRLPADLCRAGAVAHCCDRVHRNHGCRAGQGGALVVVAGTLALISLAASVCLTVRLLLPLAEIAVQLRQFAATESPGQLRSVPVRNGVSFGWNRLVEHFGEGSVPEALAERIEAVLSAHGPVDRNRPGGDRRRAGGDRYGRPHHLRQSRHGCVAGG